MTNFRSRTFLIQNLLYRHLQGIVIDGIQNEVWMGCRWFSDLELGFGILQFGSGCFKSFFRDWKCFPKLHLWNSNLTFQLKVYNRPPKMFWLWNPTHWLMLAQDWQGGFKGGWMWLRVLCQAQIHHSTTPMHTTHILLHTKVHFLNHPYQKCLLS